MTTMIDEKDKPMLDKWAGEATNLRSREAFAMMLEHAYVLGRRAELAEARRIIFGERRVPSETDRHG